VGADCCRRVDGVRHVAMIALAYRRLLELLAVVAGVLLAAMALATVVDILMRNLGFQPATPSR
jgi:hypothetical protein